MAQRILRPLSYGDLFDELFDLYKKHFILFLGISGIVTVPTYALAYAIGGTAAPAIAGLLVMVLTVVAIAASTWAVSKCYLGEETTIADSYKAIGRSAVPFVMTMIAAYLRIYGGFLLLIVPGVILLFRYAFISEVFILEGKRGKEARARSAFLAKGNEGRIFVLALLSGILSMIVTAILTVPIEALAAVFASNGAPATVGGPVGLIYGVLTGVASALTAPIEVMAFVLLYYDIRVRKEGFDIEMLANNMGASLPPAASVSVAAGPETVATAEDPTQQP